MPESHRHLDVAEGKSLSKRDPRQISTSRANIPSHTFRKAFPQGATIRFNNVKYGEILSKKRKAILLSLFEEKFKTRNSRGSDEKVEQTWRLRNYEAESVSVPEDADIYQVEIFNDALENLRVE